MNTANDNKTVSRSDGRIIAEMWYCGDEVCNCHQPQITERDAQGHLIREIESGPFRSEPEHDEWKEQIIWLLQKAREFKAENLSEIEEEYKNYE